MSQGGRAHPYSGQASLASAASHQGELLAGGTEAEVDRTTELERMQAAAKQAEREETRAMGAPAPQPGGTAAQVKAGAEYLEKEVREDCVDGSIKPSTVFNTSTPCQSTHTAEGH